MRYFLLMLVLYICISLAQPMINFNPLGWTGISAVGFIIGTLVLWAARWLIVEYDQKNKDNEYPVD